MEHVVPTDPGLALLQDVVTSLVGSPLEVEPILARVTALMVPRLADLAIIYLLRDGRELDRLAVIHRDPAKGRLVHELQRRYPPDLSAPIGLALVLRTGRPELIVEAPAQTFEPLMLDDEQRALVSAIAPRSYITVALKADGVILGALQLLITESDRRYNADDLVVAEAVGQSCGLALRNARLHTALQAAHHSALAASERMDRLRLLVEALNAATLPAEVARVVTEHGALALGARTAALALRVGDGDRLAIAHAVGYPPEVVAAWRSFPLAAATPIGDAIRSGEPIWLADEEERRARYPELGAAQSLTGRGTIAALPLLVDGQTIGALGIGFGVGQTFDAEARTLLLTLAHQCALALERARLYEAERVARTRAEAALRQRDQFLSAAAHELRTPLTSLLGNVQLLQRRARHRGERGDREAQMLDVVGSQALRLSKLITTLLMVTELEAGQLTLAQTQVDLCTVGRRVLAELEPFAEGHALVCDVPDHVVLVQGDEVRLAAMIEELLRNAIAHSPTGGPVTLKIGLSDGWAELAVIDQGLGIAAEALPRIFERFYRAPHAPPAGGGLGVNLWLAREVARRHGGELLVASVVGAGSTFTVRLPTLAA
jgi:signal transduction histidine kinase